MEQAGTVLYMYGIKAKARLTLETGWFMSQQLEIRAGLAHKIANRV